MQAEKHRSWLPVGPPQASLSPRTPHRNVLQGDVAGCLKCLRTVVARSVVIGSSWRADLGGEVPCAHAPLPDSPVPSPARTRVPTDSRGGLLTPPCDNGACESALCRLLRSRVERSWSGSATWPLGCPGRRG